MPDEPSVARAAVGPQDREQLAGRLRNRFKHLRKWARRTEVSCWRLYDKDIPDQPLIVDWYDGDAVVWAYDRTRNETPADEEAWLAMVRGAVSDGLAIGDERIHCKRRFRQKDRHLGAEEREGQGQYAPLGRGGPVKVVGEQGLRFEVNLGDYLDTGLFLDHRPTRALVRGESAGRTVLNLFAYTGSFTCYAAAGGATRTTTVDLSNTYLDWAVRNLGHNGFAAGDAHALVKADSFAFLERAASAKEAWDVVVCDPPTFSTSSAMRESFSVQRDHPRLIALCRRVLRPGGVLWFSTNCRGFTLADGIEGLAIADRTADTVPEDFRNRTAHRCWRMVRS